MVKILIENINSKIVGYLPDNVHKDLDKALSYEIANARHMSLVKRGKWDGVIHLYMRHKGQQFYTGLMAFVREILKKNDIEFQLEDRRIKPKQNLPHLKFEPPKEWNYEERDYQTFTVDRSLKFTRGILGVCTGGGKTLIVTRQIADIKTAPFIFYVLTKDLMYQAHETMTKCLNEPIGLIGDGKCDIKNINVMTIQTAIRSLNKKKKFNIKDYKFDEEDVWKEEDVDEETADKIQRLIRSAKGVYMDECISGDSILQTEKGPIKIEDIKSKKCRYVLSYDGINVVYKSIIKWIPKGSQDTVVIKFEDGDITCTKDHLIYTSTGWIEAAKIKKGETVLFANADAEHILKKINMEEKGDSFLDTKLIKEATPNGRSVLRNICPNLQNVNVAADQKSDLHTIKLNLLSIQEELLDIRNISKATTNSRYITSITLSQLKRKFKLLWERVWETLPSSFQIKDLETIDYVQLMDLFKKNGSNTNQVLSIGLECLLKTLLTVDMEIIQQECGQDVYHALQRLRTLFTMGDANKFQKNGLILLETLDSLGGSAMMEVILVIECLLLYILRDLTKKITKLSKDGLTSRDLIAESQETENTIIFYLMLKALLRSKISYSPMCLNVCNTNWKIVQNISEGENKLVYDIEVEDTHCFFANDILVHNCHHTSATTCREVLEASAQAYWRFGGSATPYRETGDDILIQAMFGSKIVEISASYLIKRGYLIKPYIFMVPVDSKVDLHTYQKIYKHCISDNAKLNDHVAELSQFLNGLGLSNLILVQHYPQGNYIKKILGDKVQFVTGKMTSKKRKESINDLRERKTESMIATSLADEGLDIPVLDSATMAGGGASATRVNQKIGRTLRKSNDPNHEKTRSIVIIYEHNARFLEKHAKKVRHILKKEPEFEVVNSKGIEFLFDEIREVLGLPKENKTIFEV